MNVLLIGFSYRAIGLRIMHAMLENEPGVNVSTVFFEIKATRRFADISDVEISQLKDLIEKIQPDLVGFSLMTLHLPTARKLTSILRGITKAKIIWGGIHPTICPEDCIEHADMVCRGEGEYALLDVVRAMRDAKPVQGIENLWIKSNGALEKNPLRPLIANLDDLPIPAYKRPGLYFFEDKEISQRDSILDKEKRIFIASSRGCPNACAFCVNSILRPLYKNLGPKVRVKSPRSIVDEIKYVMSLGKCFTKVHFLDEVFAEDPNWAKEFCALYKAEVGLQFRVDYTTWNISTEVYAMLRGTGLSEVRIGVQAPSDTVRKKVFRRHGTNEDLVRVATAIYDKNVTICYEFIVNNPYDTAESLRDGIELALRLPAPKATLFHSLIYFPNYPLTNKALKDGIITPDAASPERIERESLAEWDYSPKLFPLAIVPVLQSILWLCFIHPRDEAVRKALPAAGQDIRLSLALLLLHLTAVSIGWRRRSSSKVSQWSGSLQAAFGYVKRGDIVTLSKKIFIRLTS